LGVSRQRPQEQQGKHGERRFHGVIPLLHNFYTAMNGPGNLLSAALLAAIAAMLLGFNQGA
jgi:hypothetical protein